MRTFSLALAAGLALLTGAPSAMAQADAHAGHHPPAAATVQTTPADGAMGAAPTEFSATFPHPMLIASVSVTREGGEPIVVAIPRGVLAETVSVPLPALAPGNYTISWSATGADGHVMNGVVRYMVH